jgi:hypothetical protein
VLDESVVGYDEDACPISVGQASSIWEPADVRLSALPFFEPRSRLVFVRSLTMGRWLRWRLP